MGKTIGKYEISEQIGVGGFGAVFRGRDPFIKRTVAVKTCQLNDEEIKNRFFREAELAGNLHHRNITTIYDFGVEEGIPYIVQEFLTGDDLDKIVKKGDPLTVARKVEILMAIADGLGYAHKQHIIHRDIKPSNIRILDDGSVKIMDFGIAKSLLSESSLTQTGITLGTSAYLAPEQIRGEQLDQRTDIFALGVLSYELLTGRKPFRGEHLSTVLYKILNETPESISAVAPDVPVALANIVALAMEKNIENRYASMEALRNDLNAVYRQVAQSSGRFLTTPNSSRLSRDLDPDATIRTPSKGMLRSSQTIQSSSTPVPPSASARMPAPGITPPSGALARVPASAGDDHTPTEIAIRVPGGNLELVHFQDPSERPSGQTPLPTGKSRTGLWIGIVVVLLVGGGYAAWKMGWIPAPGTSTSASTTGTAETRKSVPVVPTAPLAFPNPQIGSDAPAVQPTALPVPTAVPAVEKAEKVEPPPPVRPPRRFQVQFSSIPESTLFVDGRRIGSSIPAKSVELPEGNHTVRFERSGIPPYEKAFKVGANGAPPIAYRFPLGYLVVSAPAWTGATVLIDSKFQGVLTREMSIPLASGTHQVTLSRAGLNPYTAEVTIPEGEKKTWTPPPPTVHTE
jgi:serine/threonine-protein kinase